MRANGPTIEERLAGVRAEALAAKVCHELPWELFRLQYFPGWPHERVAAALGIWQRSAGIDVKWDERER
jgi:hypothetical protein